jgi:hypothetical protein
MGRAFYRYDMLPGFLARNHQVVERDIQVSTTREASANFDAFCAKQYSRSVRLRAPLFSSSDLLQSGYPCGATGFLKKICPALTRMRHPAGSLIIVLPGPSEQSNSSEDVQHLERYGRFIYSGVKRLAIC